MLTRTRGTFVALTPGMTIEFRKNNSNHDIHSYFCETTIWCNIVLPFLCFTLYTYIIISYSVHHMGPQEIWLFISTDVQFMICSKGRYIVIIRSYFLLGP